MNRALARGSLCTERSISAASRLAARIAGGMDFELLAHRECEQLQQTHRVFAEVIVGGDRDAATVEDESAEPFGAPAKRGKCEAETLLAELLVEMREEHAGQVADRFRVQEIELHEALDRGFPGRSA